MPLPLLFLPGLVLAGLKTIENGPGEAVKYLAGEVLIPRPLSDLATGVEVATTVLRDDWEPEAD